MGLRELGERLAELAEALEAISAAALSRRAATPASAAQPAAAAPAPRRRARLRARRPSAPAAGPARALQPGLRRLRARQLRPGHPGLPGVPAHLPGHRLRRQRAVLDRRVPVRQAEVRRGHRGLERAARDYPASDKLPDARVKKGMALERLGRRSQALVEYRFVVDRYPNSEAARMARERLNP